MELYDAKTGFPDFKSPRRTLMMQMEMIYREYEEGDERGIFELYSRINPQTPIDYDMWLKKWKWLYRDGPYGRSRIWLAVDNGRIVGQYPTIFWKLKIHGEETLSVQTVELVADPDIRVPGAFLMMGKTAVDALAESDVRMVWAFPNEIALGGHVRSGMRRIGPISMLFRVLNPFNIFLGEPDADRLRKIPDGLVKIDRFDERCNVLIEEFGRSRDLITARSVAHLNWRYPDSFGFKKYYLMDGQEVLGYLVYKVMRKRGIRVGVLFDIVYRDSPALRKLVRCFCRLCSKDHASIAAFYCLVKDSERKEFLRAGFWTNPFYHRISLYGMLMPEKGKTDTSQFKNVYFTIGDSDYIE
jgi:hypothetical protein